MRLNAPTVCLLVDADSYLPTFTATYKSSLKSAITQLGSYYLLESHITDRTKMTACFVVSTL